MSDEAGPKETALLNALCDYVNSGEGCCLSCAVEELAYRVAISDQSSIEVCDPIEISGTVH